MSTQESVQRSAAHGGESDPRVFQLVPQAPPLAPHELESEQVAVEIMIVWGDTSILHVAHLSPPRSFWVGEHAADGGKPDFILGADSLGCGALPIVLERAGALSVVLPAGARGEVEASGSCVSFEELAQQGRLQPTQASPGAHAYPLAKGVRVHVRCGALTFIVSCAPAGQRVGIGGAPQLSLSESRWTLASVAMHAFLLGCFYFMPPASAALSMDALAPSPHFVPYDLDGLEPPPPPPAEGAGDPGAGGGSRASGDEGATGAPDKPKQPAKRKIAAPAASAPVARDPLGAASAGIIEVLGRELARPTATRFARESANGYDEENVLTALLGQAETSGGFMGLGSRGTGHGGGGNADGTVGVGLFGTRGVGAGVDGPGYGVLGPGLGAGTRDPNVPHRIRHPVAQVVGSLSKETIRRIVGRHEAEVRFCYQEQLRAHPDLQGRIAIKFIISPTGAVQTAQVAQSDLGSPAVGQCIAQSVQRWVFPAPEGGGLVIVTYPFVLSQTGN